MDKRSSQKIRRFILVWGIFMILIWAGIFVFYKFEANISKMQMKEISTIYAEKQEAIVESFDYYEKQKNHIYIYTGVIIGLVAFILFCSIYLIEDRADRKEREIEKDNLNLLITQLSKFRKGEYQVNVSLPVQTNIISNGEQWENLWDKLKEFGFYFEGLKQQLEAEENSTKTLISDISHQLKTPLASLRMSHELTQGEGLTIEEKQEFLQKEEIEIHRLEFLMQELVNLSRLENHMIQIQPEKNSIKKTITEAINLVFMKAIAKQIQIQVDIEKDVIVCHDTKWTVEAISNVIDNAIKYSPENSEINIRVETLPNLLLINIEDQGIGISSEDIHKIYQRFYRGKEAGKFAKDGAGIGLYLSRKILEQEGGTIVAKRKYENGTIFKITLPL